VSGMGPWAIFATAFTVGLSGAMMPGPLLTMAIGESGRLGFWAGPLLVLGHGLLELALVIGLLFGLGGFLAKTSVAGLIGLVGGAFLLWMGRELWLGARTQVLDLDGGSAPAKGGPILAGITISASNPYWLMWWATIGAAYVNMALQHGTKGVALFLGGHLLADLAWYSLIAAAATAGKSFMSPRLYQGILGLCGLFLMALAAYFIYSGFAFLMGASSLALAL
jgi:threonine/homoserine/homoserine lactone efflux protein